MLGVVTSVGGFVEVGSISTAAQAGAEFDLRLLWAIAIAGLCAAALVEMAGRVAALSGHTFVAAVRERFGFHFQMVPLGAEVLLDVLLLAAELGGAAVALRLLTSIGLGWWLLPIVCLAWALVWFGSFSVVEHGLGLLGLVTLVFVVAAVRLGPAPGELARGLLPTLPPQEWTRYALLALSILGATVSPYLLNFYASGAVEDGWTEADLPSNRITAFLGMGFGSVVSMGVLVAAALTLAPQGIRVDSYEQAALMLAGVFGRAGVPLFTAALFVGCFGAAVEIALNLAYALAQSFGWTWGVNRPRTRDARFSVAMVGALVLGGLVAASGVDPLSLTMVSMALTVLVMPVIVLPAIVIMNDPHYVGRHPNHVAGNLFLAVIVVAATVLAVVVIPLELLGH
jgi:Mn2+/Fe2+ NRAMP family transporter